MLNQRTNNKSEELHQFHATKNFQPWKSRKLAQLCTYSLVQQHHLAEFRLIGNGKIVPRNNNSLSISPFFDDESNLIRVGGRLANSLWNIDKKIPLPVPRKSPIKSLLIRKAHERSFHSGAQKKLHTLRQTVWIPGGLPLVKQVIHHCQHCIRHDARWESYLSKYL